MLDCEGILRAQFYGQAVRQERASADASEQRAADLERELAVARAEGAAHDAGRLAQVAALRRALEQSVPLHPLLRRTGRWHVDGTSEVEFEAAYVPAYDAVATTNEVPQCRRPLTRAERAAEAEASVLAEPVTVRWTLWWRRHFWRGSEYRSAGGAIRARAEAARLAREALS